MDPPLSPGATLANYTTESLPAYQAQVYSDLLHQDQ